MPATSRRNAVFKIYEDELEFSHEDHIFRRETNTSFRPTIQVLGKNEMTGTKRHHARPITGGRQRRSRAGGTGSANREGVRSVRGTVLDHPEYLSVVTEEVRPTVFVSTDSKHVSNRNVGPKIAIDRVGIDGFIITRFATEGHRRWIYVPVTASLCKKRKRMCFRRDHMVILVYPLGIDKMPNPKGFTTRFSREPFLRLRFVLTLSIAPCHDKSLPHKMANFFGLLSIEKFNLNMPASTSLELGIWNSDYGTVQ
ncbi:hypothetical protein V8E53_000853 [Lactarius tabidus]